MRCIYSSPDSVRVGLIRSVLEASDISCEVRNEAVSQVMVGIPFASELWVQDKDYENATSLVAEPRSE